MGKGKTDTMRPVGRGKSAPKRVLVEPVVNEDVKVKRARPQKSTREWSNYIKRIFYISEKTLAPEERMRIKGSCVSVLNSIVNDVIDRIGDEAGNLCKFTRSNRLRTRDLHSAISLVTYHTELSRIMTLGGHEALERYVASQHE